MRRDKSTFKMRLCYLPALFTILFAASAFGAVLHVPSQYPTLQAAIDAAADGDEVRVADGNYTGEGNINLDFKGKELTLQSENGPENCIIDCKSNGRGFFFHNGELKDSIVSGFTITNGRTVDQGGGICIKGSSPTIINCILTNNEVTGNNDNSHGGAIYCSGGSSPEITNCAIIRNTSNYTGGAIYSDNSEPKITNCTITRNVARTGGGIYCKGKNSPVITNCIFWGNTPNEVASHPVNTYSPPITYSLVQDGYLGKGNIKTDPLFVGSGDFYHLTRKSPCIKAGTLKDAPATDIDGDARRKNPRIDIGADEYSSQTRRTAATPEAAAEISKR